MTRSDTFSSDHLDFPGAETLMAAGRVEPPKAETVAAAQAVLRAAIERDTEAAAVPPSAARARRRAGLARLFFRPRVVVTALAAAVAAGVVAYPALTASDSAPTQPASAKTFLNDMAQVAASAPATKAPYWKTTLTINHRADGRKPQTLSWYLDRKGKTTMVNPDGSTTVAVTIRGYTVGDRNLDWNQLDKLPTDPKALASLLPSANSANSAGGKAKSTFNHATDLLGQSPARPELRAALYRVLADLPGVEVAGPAKDITGRTGTALEWTTDSTTVRLIINPKTGDLLEETETAPRTGALEARYTYLTNAPADKIG